jgi:hypothetical protein
LTAPLASKTSIVPEPPPPPLTTYSIPSSTVRSWGAALTLAVHKGVQTVGVPEQLEVPFAENAEMVFVTCPVLDMA